MTMSDRQYQVGRNGEYRRTVSKEEQRAAAKELRKFRKYEQVLQALGNLAHARQCAIENPAGPEADVFARKYKLSIDDLRRLEAPEALLEEILKRV